MNKHLHIIAFNVPFPPSYGGVIDVYFKCKLLTELGVKVTLHCFEYGRAQSEELNSVCEKVYYYKRKKGLSYLFNTLPYIVATRQSQELVSNLCKDKHPILFEGLHCCYHFSDPQLAGRLKIVRTQNIEHDYYAALGRSEHNPVKRLHFKREARKLKAFETILSKADHILAITRSDEHSLSSRYKNVLLAGPFHPNTEMNIIPGEGTYTLYHGNLGVAENVDAALYLVNNVFNDCEIPLVIAGQDPPAHLTEAISKHKNIQFKSITSNSEILKLVKEAQINVLPTFQPTGIKLKLLFALYNGRHCVVNNNMVESTGLEEICHINNDAASMRNCIQKLFNTPFTKQEINKREEKLFTLYNNTLTAEKIIQLL